MDDIKEIFFLILKIILVGIALMTVSYFINKKATVSYVQTMYKTINEHINPKILPPPRYPFIADCKVKWLDSGGQQEFSIDVNAYEMVLHAIYGTHTEKYLGNENGRLHYITDDNDYNTYLSKYENGEFDFFTYNSNKDALHGKCVIRH